MYTDLIALTSSEDPAAIQSEAINPFYAEESDSSISCHSLARKEELLQQEIKALRSRIHELEQIAMIKPETAPSDHEDFPATSTVTSSPEYHSTPLSSFEEGWRARTAARKKLFCSLNRAGNCLCAWHDSRRERRAYPPRMAPPGYLNCGCTHDEALFEESLARHGVGSYKPGEHVRMDPALRNPLLKLLKERYGYRDGDFERDPVTGDWVCDEEPTIWEPLTASPGSSRYGGCARK